ncbi:class I adenylate-forming enzyme family protein [Microbacterium sp. No. 7]|uniref:class I adenylate-forming enzyme family protein n=1 Tax=Microbacterium sp. No. 7 TaxID=1714373 RepID=UPI0006CFC499|nr:AMP-binding protein [Microbacterium sp. No. 7]ALJ18842.1 hypothetical protein AOA12_02515 [Microbacterium sp. No. 7]
MSAADQPTLAEVVTRAAAAAAGVPLVFVSRDGRRRLTLGELIERSRRVAGGLAARGVARGDRVAVQLPSTPEQASVQIACALLGAVYVPVVPLFGAAELAAMLSDARPRVLVTGTRWRGVDFDDVLAGIEPGLLPPHVVRVGAAPGAGTSFSDLCEAPALAEAARCDPSDDCLIIYTSGSSDAPKGVVHTHSSVLHEAREWQYLPAETDPASVQILQATGAGHIGGFMYLVRALRHGVGTCVLDWWDAELALQCLVSEDISVLPCTTHHLATVLDLAEQRGADLSRLARVVLGGGPVPPALIRRADRAGVVAVRAYGLSEHPTATIGRFDDPLEVRESSEGRANAWSRVRVVDDAGRDAAPGEVGEILLRGGEQCVRYTNRPREEAFTADGWLRTGDLGVLDVDDRLTVVDRKKNIIIRGGENISVAEVEREVSRHPGVAEVAAFGIPHDTLGEVVCASVVLRDGADASPDGIRRFLAEHGVARQKIPADIDVVAELPKGGLQKIRRNAVRQSYLDRRARLSPERKP